MHQDKEVLPKWTRTARWTYNECLRAIELRSPEIEEGIESQGDKQRGERDADKKLGSRRLPTISGTRRRMPSRKRLRLEQLGTGRIRQRFEIRYRFRKSDSGRALSYTASTSCTAKIWTRLMDRAVKYARLAYTPALPLGAAYYVARGYVVPWIMAKVLHHHLGVMPGGPDWKRMAVHFEEHQPERISYAGIVRSFGQGEVVGLPDEFLPSTEDAAGAIIDEHEEVLGE
ncbi:hypothetical protein V1508DRAFT_433026 [Lipomyces doorenjongii]|uniref:uncharacterized protein n=1 Tax=Lipomyces doorenjongii TaxID=383834 RepID=UPI0034CD639B